METLNNLKQRLTGDKTKTETETTTTIDKDENNKKRRAPMNKKNRITKRGLTSLAAAISIPVTLTTLAICLLSSNSYAKATTPFWFPSAWAVHVASGLTALLMGLAAWLVWAEGGFHSSPMALYVYLGQLGLGLVWDPMVFGAGSGWVGLILVAGLFGSLLGCYKAFKEVNLLAGQLVKPCLAWTAFLLLLNITLVCL